IATVDPASGLITGVSAGNVTITATSEGKAGNVLLRVLSSVATVSITAPHDSVLAGSITLQTTVVLRDGGGNILTGRVISYASSNTALALASTTGLVSGVGTAGGTVNISATSEGITSATPLVVRVLAPISTIIVTAPDSSVNIGNSVTATATPKDAGNNTLTGRPITWSSSSPLIAMVSSGGLVTSVAAGQISVTAAAEGKSGLIPLFRSLGPVTTVTVTPPSRTMNLLQTAQLTVTVTDDAAFSPNPLGGVACTMDSNRPLFAAPVSANGTTSASGTFNFSVVSFLLQGQVTITVTCAGKVGTSDITVQ
ncbi:MAG: Ig-like domain-containing protein, partial [Gemmatimonadaceae bacterium]